VLIVGSTRFAPNRTASRVQSGGDDSGSRLADAWLTFDPKQLLAYDLIDSALATPQSLNLFWPAIWPKWKTYSGVLKRNIVSVN